MLQIFILKWRWSLEVKGLIKNYLSLWTLHKQSTMTADVQLKWSQQKPLLKLNTLYT